jgi:hypothetical protein
MLLGKRTARSPPFKFIKVNYTFQLTIPSDELLLHAQALMAA